MKTAQQVIHDIKKKIEPTGLKMSDLCRVMDIDQAQMSRWMSGTTEPLYSTVIKMEHAANVLLKARMKALNLNMKAHMKALNKAMEDAVK
jgi:predicted transcriptional regulator